MPRAGTAAHDALSELRKMAALQENL